MRLGRLVVAVLLVLLSVGAFGLYVVSSIKEDVARMQMETPVIFIVNPESGMVEIGFSTNRSTGEVLLVDSEQMVGDRELRSLFTASEEEGAALISGAVLRGYTYSGGALLERSVRADRTVLVDDTVVARIFSLVEPQRVEIGEKGGVFYAESTVDSETLLAVLRGDFDALVWEVEFTLPVVNRQVVRRATTSELLELAERFDIRAGEDIVRALVLAQAGEALRPLLQTSEGRLELIRILLQEYRAGSIRTYPENTLTKVLRLIPEEQVLRQLEGRV
ncbi:MAG: hypothetical protein GXO66_06680 [Euryarchaeota archaeon]|nr:hypothetical protein [Euryarchaeota archaeon]